MTIILLECSTFLAIIFLPRALHNEHPNDQSMNQPLPTNDKPMTNQWPINAGEAGGKKVPIVLERRPPSPYNRLTTHR